MNNSLYPDAIQAIRQGHFAMSQMGGGMILWLLIGVFVTLMGIGMVVMALSDFSIANIGLGFVFLWLGYNVGGNMLIDIALGSVSMIEGKGEKSMSSSGKSIKRSYWVGEQRLDVSSSTLLGKLNNHEHVRAYYLSRSKSLVNLEW